MMNLRKFSAVLMLAACLPAAADIKILSRAVETSTAYLNVPTSENSRLMFKSCDDCELLSVRLTSSTQFFVHGKQMPFADFRREFNNMRHSKEDYALVTFDTETNAVTSVRVAD
jgi:hypothetical protein